VLVEDEESLENLEIVRVSDSLPDLGVQLVVAEGLSLLESLVRERRHEVGRLVGDRVMDHGKVEVEESDLRRKRRGRSARRSKSRIEMEGTYELGVRKDDVSDRLSSEGLFSESGLDVVQAEGRKRERKDQ
jgi:hypothetical protein